ncbi:MAG: hypothetical protein HN669_09375, partial [Candidatus Marinimicrobia bacterium]|nr:hypothetical protein [Candidatus Neomarinimicrobiota bacterium]
MPIEPKKSHPVGPKLSGDAEKRRKNIIESLILITIFSFALFLRLYNLGILPPYVDEYFHLNAAKSLLQGVSREAVYQRSFFTVTLPVALSFKLFGMEIWAAQVPGAILGAMAMIPLYLITKKINKYIAIL